MRALCLSVLVFSSLQGMALDTNELDLNSTLTSKSIIAPQGKLLAVAGPVCSSKTDTLIRYADVLYARGLSILVLKHIYDVDRTHNTNLQTHDGLVFPSYAINEEGNILEENKDGQLQTILPLEDLANSDMRRHAIFLDEIQFFNHPEHILQILLSLAAKGAFVFVAGLDEDFARRTDKFGAWLDFLRRYSLACPGTVIIKKVFAPCSITHCNNPAAHSQRLINNHAAYDDDPLVLIGGVETYVPRCDLHHCVLSHSRSSL